MIEKAHTVVGMTCDHCVLWVREEISQLTGVAAVEVDLASRRLRVRGEDVSDAAVSEAVGQGWLRAQERRMNTRYLTWAAATGAAGCGRCAAAA